MATGNKPRIAFAGVELAASSAVAWRFTTGTRPYQAVFSAYYRDWDATLRQKIGQTSNLSITDTRSKTLNIEGLTILHEVPSTAPNLRSFVVADKRWKWQYPLISSD